MEGTVPKTSRMYWGPLLWRMFHLMAELSDKHEVLMLWKKWFQQTAEIMPCEKCRLHLRQYLQTNSFIVLHIPSSNPTTIQNHIRDEIMKLHNHVNANTGKAMFTLDQHAEIYGKKTRSEILLETQDIMNELEASLQLAQHVQMRRHEFSMWKGSFIRIRLLLQ